MKIKEKYVQTCKGCSILDWILAAVIILFCFISYQHADIRITGAHTMTLLNGHIWDFYEVNKAGVGLCNYMPSTYIVFGIWMLPLKLLGWISEPTMEVGLKVRLWYKMLTTVVYILTTGVTYKIGREMEMNKKNAMIFAFIFFTNPIGIFSQFCFGQYDILTTLFVMLGVYYYIKNDNRKYIASFAVAITFKYFALLFFIPMLLVKQKDVLKIIRDCIAVMLLFVFEVALFWHSPAFREGVFGFSATSYIFNMKLDLGFTQISLAIIAWLVLCGYAYFKNVDSDSQISLAVFVMNIVTFISFGMSFWHPQWLLMAVPAWIMGTVMSKRRDIFLLLDTLMYLFYMVFTVNFWTNAIDQQLFHGMFFSKFIDTTKLGCNMIMADILKVSDKNTIFTCYAGVLLVYTLFKLPKYQFSVKEMKNVNLEESKWIIRIRYLVGTLVFIGISVFVLYKNATFVG